MAYPQYVNNELLYASTYNVSVNSGSTLSGSRVNAIPYKSVKFYALGTHANVVFRIFTNFAGISNQVQWTQVTSGSVVANILTGSTQTNLLNTYADLYNTSGDTRYSGSLWYIGSY